MLKNQPKGLYVLTLANTFERLGYYILFSILMLYLEDQLGLNSTLAGFIYSMFLFLVYFLPIIGGIIADIFGYGKMVVFGVLLLLLGYIILAIPLGNGSVSLIATIVALLLVAHGLGLFKGNLQVMVGNLYDDPQYSKHRDSGFIIFYLFLNIGAMLTPIITIELLGSVQSKLGMSIESSFHLASAIACVSIILSFVFYSVFRHTFKHAENSVISNRIFKKNVPNIHKLPTSNIFKRIIFSVIVLNIILFFWIALKQNGITLSFFAKDFTVDRFTGLQVILSDVWNMVLISLIVYAIFVIYSYFKNWLVMSIAGGVITICVIIFIYHNLGIPEFISVSPHIYQQFNPFFVIIMAPVVLALFGWLANKGKEPNTAHKIGIGLIVTALAFFIMLIGSIDLPSPNKQMALDSIDRVSPNWLISTYLVLAIGELLISPMCTSLITKIAPPKFKGLIMGCLLGTMAISTYLMSITIYFWDRLPLWIFWSVLIGVCLISAFAMLLMKNALEKITK